MEEAASYVQRGRRFADVPIEEINAQWVSVVRAFFADTGGDPTEMSDLGAEIRLRGLLPPEDLVKGEVMAMAVRLKNHRDDPALKEAIGRRVDEILVQRAEPMN